MTSIRTIGRAPVSWRGLVPLLLALSAGVSTPASGQLVGREDAVTLARGQSTLLVQPVPVERVSIGDPNIADAVVVSPREILVNGLALGTTSLIIWDAAGGRRVYPVEVTADAPSLQRTIGALYPAERVAVTASGNVVILTGIVSDARIARQIRDLAAATGATVIDNLSVPAPQQVLLQVRIAELSEGVLSELGPSAVRVFNPDNLEGTGDWLVETISDGLMRVFLLDPTASVDVILQALRTTTDFRMLAEPNLLAMEGAEATFLAGGEFPFPTLQAGAASNAVTIEWREFGVQLKFTPMITGSGNIRLVVAPEVSSLDFASGLVVGGFAVPALRTRRAATEVELRDGQTFAIAGLLDNTTLETAARLPVLGHLPIIGALFRNREKRQNQTQLLVLVTPRLVSPVDGPVPVPTGEPDTWRWDRRLRPPPTVNPASPTGGAR